MKPRGRKILFQNDDDLVIGREPPPRSTAESSPPPLPHHYPTNNSSDSPLMSKRASPNSTTGTSTASPFDSSMALTVLVLLTALFFMGFFSVYIRRFADDSSVDLSRRRHPRHHPSASSSPAPPHSAVPPKGGLDPSTVRSLPLFPYGADPGGDPGECAVCLGEFHEKETIKVIPYCRHVFHPLCIDAWLSSHASCPLCRTTRLFPTKEGVDGGGGLDALGGEGDLSARELGRRSAVESDDTWRDAGTSMPRTSSLSQ